MNVGRAIDDVQDAETDLAGALRAISERHAVEHDIYHLGQTLARRCATHLAQLEPLAGRYEASTSAKDPAESPAVLETLRRKGSEMLCRSEMSGGMLLLRDLRQLYLTAQDTEIAWVILGQCARAVRDRDLLDVTDRCHHEAEMIGKWLRTRIKEASPQILATG